MLSPLPASVTAAATAVSSVLNNPEYDAQLQQALAASLVEQPVAPSWMSSPSSTSNDSSHSIASSMAVMFNEAGSNNCFLNTVVQVLRAHRCMVLEIYRLAALPTAHKVMKELAQLLRAMDAAEAGGSHR
jgi:hypothetical protein